jgi:hypothetical protein
MCGNTELETCIDLPVPLAVPSKMWVCGRSLAGIVGSNTGGVTDICCECWVFSPSKCGVTIQCDREAPQKKKINYKK